MFSGHQSFFSTTASVLRCGVVGKDFLVVVDDAAHVRHAAAAAADFFYNHTHAKPLLPSHFLAGKLATRYMHKVPLAAEFLIQSR